MPAGKTYIKIASQSLSSATASVTFSNIPQNYTDLFLVVSASPTLNATNAFKARFNGDSGSLYSNTYMYAGSSTGGGREADTTARFFSAINPSGNTSYLMHIPNYSNNFSFKNILSKHSSPGSVVEANINLYRSTSPITSIQLFYDLSANNMITGSTFILYGIEAAKSPKATGGDKIYTTGTHWVHEFYNSGLFVPQVALSSVDYLVIAGGGSGGGNGGSSRGAGGGGAGGYLTSIGGSSISLTASSGYTITVGAGGTRVTGEAPGLGKNGSNSSISGLGITTVTAIGGGGGGAYVAPDYVGGSNGGSGGGASGQTGLSAGSGTAGQGNSGGTGLDGSGYYPGGGGGGAGGTGGNASGTTAGSGGAGTASSITGSSVTRAGGGGGSTRGATNGSGGSGGGGAGGSGDGTSGTINTGGGGGAAGTETGGTVRTSGAGGSGIVIVRYAV